MKLLPILFQKTPQGSVASFLSLLALSILIQKQSPEVFLRKGVLRNLARSTGKHLCQSLCFNRVYFKVYLYFNNNFIKIETLAQVFSWEFCEISKNTLFTLGRVLLQILIFFNIHSQLFWLQCSFPTLWFAFQL